MNNIFKKLKESKKNLFVGVAGPGTGKSYTFKEIIESEEFKNRKILILSFINKLVDDLSKEFEKFKNVRVSTLHAFAKQELEKNIGDVDLDQDLDDIISEDYFYLVKKNINYGHKFCENNLDKDEEKFYKERKDFYRYDKNLYSFNSIIHLFNIIFSKHESKIPKYDLILIDEFQDFNASEYELIKLLNKKTKIILVGDENQSLYDFKKAVPNQIIDLYNDASTEEFSLDYCYRCTEVIVNATNSLIENSIKLGLLKKSEKKFLYPEGNEQKDKISSKYQKIDFIPSISGALLIYQLAKNIKKDIKNIEKDDKKRILILAPNYLKQNIYEGLIAEGFNIVEFELFSNEECNNKKHKYIIDAFETLVKRKTDNLSLRKVLFLYLSDKEIIEILEKDKKIWFSLDEEIKLKIDKDIEIFKKVKSGKEKLSDDELSRLNNVFNLKKLLSKLIKGFKPVMKNAIEIEMTTTMSSKGLSADFVYYVGVDDQNMLIEKKLTSQKVCEFLVGITRAREKITIISLWDKNPQILELIDKRYINTIDLDTSNQ